MAAASLSDVISRMKDEGQLTRNSGTNSLKSIKQILSEQNDILKSSFTNLIAAVGAGDLISSELKMEQDRYNQRILEALEGLNKKDEKTKPDEDATEGWMALGALGTILAGTIGSAIGLIAAQVKAIGLFTPEKIKDSLKLMMSNFASKMKSLSNFIGEKASKIKSVFSTGLTKLSSLFSFGEESKIGGIISKIGKSIKDFTATFKTIGTTIKDFIVKPINIVKGWFTVIGSYMKSFGNTIGKVAGVIGKIFLPITILMTAFETITGAVEGYAKDGILGGIKGAIDGLFTSLITKPLDLLKDGVSWILGKFTFGEEASKSLDSFSFTEIFTDITQGFVDLYKAYSNFVLGIFGFREEGMGADIRNTISTVIGDAFNSIVDWINNVFSSVVESISGFDAMSMITIGEDFIKSLIRAVLPPADSLRFELPEVDLGFTKVGGGSINLNPIPDSVYEWAELPAQSPSEPSANNVPTQEPQTQLNNLEEAQSSLNQSIDNNTSVSMGGNTSVSTVNAPTSVTTSNSQVYVGSEMDPYSRRAQEDTRYGSGR